jgi:hypothetical protein
MDGPPQEVNTQRSRPSTDREHPTYHSNALQQAPEYRRLPTPAAPPLSAPVPSARMRGCHRSRRLPAQVTGLRGDLGRNLASTAEQHDQARRRSTEVTAREHETDRFTAFTSRDGAGRRTRIGDRPRWCAGHDRTRRPDDPAGDDIGNRKNDNVLRNCRAGEVLR